MVVVINFVGKYEAKLIDLLDNHLPLPRRQLVAQNLCSRCYSGIHLLKSATDVSANDERSVRRIPLSPNILGNSPLTDLFVTTYEL